MSLSDAHHFRKMVAGACMIAAPILFLVAVIVLPGIDSDAGPYLRNALEHPDAWYLQAILSLASLVLVIPATLGLMHMLREREVAWGHVGGACALVGTLALAGLSTVDLVVWQMTKGGSVAQNVALLDRLFNAEGFTIPMYLGAMLFPIGTLVLFGGLARAHAVSPAMAGVAGVGAIALIVAFFAALHWLLIAAAALYVVAYASTGLMVIRETDAEWEHTPEFQGFGLGTAKMGA